MKSKVYTVPLNIKVVKRKWDSDVEEYTRVVLHDDVVEIDGAFDGWKNLEEITLPSNLKIIGKYSFRDCRNLKSIYLPYGIREIHNQAFKNCLSLEQINLPNTLITIGKDYKMQGPTGMESAYAKTFENCKSLKSIQLPPEIVEIGGFAFYGCENLKEITIPGKVKKIGGGAFYQCTNLSNIHFEDSKSMWKIHTSISLTGIFDAVYWVRSSEVNARALSREAFGTIHGEWTKS